MTKTEYRAYIASPAWKSRRDEFLDAHTTCENCEMPRWLCVFAYDQDIHVHHLSYENLGSETNDDLSALCRRCHEIETFGRTTQKEFVRVPCYVCGSSHWNPRSDRCDACVKLLYAPAIASVLRGSFGEELGRKFVEAVRLADLWDKHDAEGIF